MSKATFRTLCLVRCLGPIWWERLFVRIEGHEGDLVDLQDAGLVTVDQGYWDVTQRGRAYFAREMRVASRGS